MVDHIEDTPQRVAELAGITKESVSAANRQAAATEQLVEVATGIFDQLREIRNELSLTKAQSINQSDYLSKVAVAISGIRDDLQGR
jgi:hypothetical protein